MKPLDVLRAIKLMMFADRVDLFDKLPNTGWYRAALTDFLDELDLKPEDKHLDVGCGAGWLALWASLRTGQSIGLDSSAKMLERAEMNKHLVPGNKASFKRGNALDLPYSDGSFDVATGTMLLPALPDPKQAVFELFRVVKQGGKIGLFLPSPALNRTNARRFARQQGYQGFDYESMLAWSMTGRRFSEGNIDRLFADFNHSVLKQIRVLDGLALAYIVKKG